MEMSGQLYACEITAVPIEEKGGWDPDPVWTFSGEEKYILSYRDLKTGPYRPNADVGL
jgi:hypothetical protein